MKRLIAIMMFLVMFLPGAFSRGEWDWGQGKIKLQYKSNTRIYEYTISAKGELITAEDDGIKLWRSVNAIDEMEHKIKYPFSKSETGILNIVKVGDSIILVTQMMNRELVLKYDLSKKIWENVQDLSDVIYKIIPADDDSFYYSSFIDKNIYQYSLASRNNVLVFQLDRSLSILDFLDRRGVLFVSNDKSTRKRYYWYLDLVQKRIERLAEAHDIDKAVLGDYCSYEDKEYTTIIAIEKRGPFSENRSNVDIVNLKSGKVETIINRIPFFLRKWTKYKNNYYALLDLNDKEEVLVKVEVIPL